MDRKKILIIDDDKSFCFLLRLNMEVGGFYKVELANNGAMGLKLAKKTKPDIIILDITMPDMNGFEVLEKLKFDKDTLSIPVIMLTADSDDASKANAQELYCEDYLVKPVAVVDLRSKIEAALKRRLEP